MRSRAEPAEAETSPRVGVDAVVTDHLDTFRSGVARFNELLAEHLGVPMLGLGRLADAAAPLLSFKVRELDAEGRRALEEWLARAERWEVFLHEFAGEPLERRLVEGATRVLCGNAEIAEQVASLGEHVETLWTPGLIVDERVFPTTEISVFTFGMAHKIRTDMFRRLKQLLDDSGRSYSVYVSAANHETATLRDAEQVFAEMHDVFPGTLYFLGNLSDVAVYNWLRSTTFFASFFTGGVRANNTSVASAMERGAVVITNLDEWSPREYVHGENIVDLMRCTELPTGAEALEQLSRNAIETSASRGWDALVARVKR